MKTLQIQWSQIISQLKNKTERLFEQRWLNLGLRAKMGALVTIGLLGLMTILGLLAISSARQATQQALKEHLTITKMSAYSLDTILFHVLDDLEIFAQSPEIANLTEDPVEDNQGIKHFTVFHRPIYYLNTSKELIASSTSSPESIPWDEIPAIENALRGQSANISPWPQYQPGTIVIATPVVDTSGRTKGILAALLDLSDPLFFPTDSKFKTNQEEVIDLVDFEGRIVFSNHEARMGQILTEALILTQLFQQKQAGVETCIGCPGTKPEELSDEVVAFAPLSSLPLGVVIRHPAAEVYASVRWLFVWHTLWGLISMVGALGLVWVTTNSVIDPLKTLNDAAKRIAVGDLDTPTGPLLEAWPLNRPRRDEIGALGESFDRMRLRLKASINEVKALNRDLDARVQKRTAQAIAAQEEAQAARDDLQAIIDALSDEMIVIDVENYQVVQVNRACRENNQEMGDPTKLHCFELFHDGHPCDQEFFTCPAEEVVKTEKPVRLTRISNETDEEQPIYKDVIAYPLPDSHGNITRIVEMVRDVTDERLMSESLVRRNQQLAVLNAVATAVSKSMDLEEILGFALKEVINRTIVEAGAIFLLEEVLGQLNLAAHLGLSEEAALMVSQFGMLDGSCGGVIDHGELVFVPDISAYRGKRAQTLRKEKLTTLIHIPLTSRDYTLGSMCVGTHQQTEFGDHEINMLLAIGKQIGVAIENTRLYAELQQKEQVRRELFRKAINAQEEERKRIARELHDDTSQALTALIFAAEEGLGIDDLGEIKTCLSRMHKLTRQTLDGVHKLLYDLRPSMLDHLGLMSAIRWFAKSRLEPLGVRVRFKETNQPCRLYPEVEIALFRVMQEAVTNINRHAGARNVEICCELNADQALINISDDGIGFDTSQITLSPESGQGLGLLGMRERLELVGGDFVLNSTPGIGTQIDIRVPLQHNK